MQRAAPTNSDDLPQNPSIPVRTDKTLIRVVVLDRNRMSSQLLADSLTRDPRFQALVAVPAEISTVVFKRAPQIAVISAELDSWRTDGTQLAQGLSRQFPNLAILILLDRVQREAVVEAFRCGAKGVFCRTDSMEEFLSCVEHVSRGEIWAGRAESDCLLDAFRNVPSPRLSSQGEVQGLTRRELQVVQYAAQGFTNKAIAEELHLSEHTVKNYLFRAFEKLGVSSRIELLFYLMVKGRKLEPEEKESKVNNQDPIERLQKAAMNGSARAQFFLGLAYRDGRGVEPSFQEAYFWFRMAERSSRDLLDQTHGFVQPIRNQLNAKEVDHIEAKLTSWGAKTEATAEDAVEEAIIPWEDDVPA